MPGLEAVDHIVVVMLENRSFDHMLGFLYKKTGQFDGLAGTESNLDPDGNKVTVFKITAGTQNYQWFPLANPAEGYEATHAQVFGAPVPPGPPDAKNDGFVTSFANELQNPAHPADPKLAGAAPSSIMAMNTADTLPVLSALAKSYAVCDGWCASVPTETLPNRAFALAGTSGGSVVNKGTFPLETSVFGKLSETNIGWKVYGYAGLPKTPSDFKDATNPNGIGQSFAEFRQDAANGALASFVFLEPQWADYQRKPPEHSWDLEDDQHPVSNLAHGERLIFDVYQALRSSPTWNQTLLIITYDEHGGCYDHVPPPTTAISPDGIVGPSGFEFTRFGVRVPTVLVSPLIPPGTILNAPADGPPFDHTSILATLRARFGIGALTKRDAAAPDVGGVLTLAEPRDDNPMDAVSPLAPVEAVLADGSTAATGVGAPSKAPTSVLVAQAQLSAALDVPGDPIDDPEAAVDALPNTAAVHFAFIQRRLRGFYGRADREPHRRATNP